MNILPPPLNLGCALAMLILAACGVPCVPTPHQTTTAAPDNTPRRLRPPSRKRASGWRDLCRPASLDGLRNVAPHLPRRRAQRGGKRRRAIWSNWRGIADLRPVAVMNCRWWRAVNSPRWHGWRERAPPRAATTRYLRSGTALRGRRGSPAHAGRHHRGPRPGAASAAPCAYRQGRRQRYFDLGTGPGRCRGRIVAAGTQPVFAPATQAGRRHRVQARPFARQPRGRLGPACTRLGVRAAS